MREPTLIPLSLLSLGESGEVVRIWSSDDSRQRLLEMGFVPGTKVLVYKIAPLGDPLEILLKGYHVSIRRDDCSSILVMRCS